MHHFRHVQDAVDAAPDGACSDLAGTYREDPTRNLPSPEDPVGVLQGLPDGCGPQELCPGDDASRQAIICSCRPHFRTVNNE